MSLQADENTWSEYVALMRRRWRPTFTVAALIALGSIYVAYTLPAIYRSSAIILIEEQGIPTEFVQTTVNAYAEQLAQTIYQRVTAAPRVVTMIQEFDLYTENRGVLPEDELLAKFWADASMTPQNITTVHSRFRAMMSGWLLL